MPNKLEINQIKQKKVFLINKTYWMYKFRIKLLQLYTNILYNYIYNIKNLNRNPI